MSTHLRTRDRGPVRRPRPSLGAIAALCLPLGLAILSGSLRSTSAALADTAVTASPFEALPTLWWAAGIDSAGEHGDGPGDASTDRAARISWRPGVEIPRGATVEHVAVGDGTACAIADGRAYCWGDNTHGQLGNASTDAAVYPTAVATHPYGGSELPDDAVVTDLSVGAGAVCAVAGHDVYCWGDNSAGRLGRDSPAGSPVPLRVATELDPGGESMMPAGGATRVVTGGGAAGSDTAFTCAIVDAGAYCWGSRRNGRLGDGIEGDVASPHPVQAMLASASAQATDIALGSHSACAVADGRAYCWGSSVAGVLGNGSNNPAGSLTVPTLVPVRPVSPGPGSSQLPSTALVTEVAVGASSACAVHDGTPYCWGTNIAGQLGADIATGTEADTTVVRRATAVARAGVGASELPVTARVHGLSAGGRLSGASSWCVLAEVPTEPDRAHCWGDDTHGQLGLGGAGEQRVPRAVLLHPLSQLPAGVGVARVAGGEGVTILLGAS